MRSAKRLSSPERWEIKQLIASGAIHASEYPDIQEDVGYSAAAAAVAAEVEEDIDIKVREDEPSFLAGQTKRTLHLSPIKIIQAPDGSLNRAALAGAALAKEQRELRQQEQNEEADSEARDFSASWLDPMSRDSERIFAQDLWGNLKAREVPRKIGRTKGFSHWENPWNGGAAHLQPTFQPLLPWITSMIIMFMDGYNAVSRYRRQHHAIADFDLESRTVLRRSFPCLVPMVTHGHRTFPIAGTCVSQLSPPPLPAHSRPTAPQPPPRPAHEATSPLPSTLAAA